MFALSIAVVVIVVERPNVEEIGEMLVQYMKRLRFSEPRLSEPQAFGGGLIDLIDGSID